MDVSRLLTESKIDVRSMNCKVNKQDTATLELGFEITGIDQLNDLMNKMRQIEGVIDIERTMG